MRTVVITGSNRGLGLGFVESYLAAGDRVFALARDPQGSERLRELAAGHEGRLSLVVCDVTEDASVAAAAAAVDGPVHLLINNAGISGRTGSSLDSLDWDDMRTVYEVNVLGPLRVTRAFRQQLAGDPARVALVTSRMGSITDNESGGWWAYRCSKSALNMACANMAMEFRTDGVACMVLHPGWVRTDMGGGGAPLDVATSVAGMVKVIDELTLATTGCFRDYAGTDLPW